MLAPYYAAEMPGSRKNWGDKNVSATMATDDDGDHDGDENYNNNNNTLRFQ